MFIGVSGSLHSRHEDVIQYLCLNGFQDCKELAVDPSRLLDYVTSKWNENFVVEVQKPSDLETYSKRPFFLHITVDAPFLTRFQRYLKHHHVDETLDSMKQFAEADDARNYRENTTEMRSQAKLTIINDEESVQHLFVSLNKLNLLDQSRLRPSWDAYFMRLANLAALRTNCMKRQVGCVLVREKRIISTGYNGTPRGLTNCNEGGCQRCNDSHNTSGVSLTTCLCLHAEENALLESGRDRIGQDAILYCNTCPCLTCSIKIVQSGISEVVYSQSYSMDEKSANVLREGGVRLRQYFPPAEGFMR